MNSKEKNLGCKKIVGIDGGINRCDLSDPKALDKAARPFSFDAVYDDNSTQ
jgi:hypothetical protein